MVTRRPSFDDALAALFGAAQRRRLNSLARPAFGRWIARSALLNEALADLFAKYARADAVQEASEAEPTAASGRERSAGRKQQVAQALLAERFECGRADAPHAGIFGPQNCFELRAVDEWNNDAIGCFASALAPTAVTTTLPDKRQRSAPVQAKAGRV